MHQTSVMLKNYSFHTSLNRSNFAFVSFQKKIFHLQNFDIMFMITPWRLLEQYILRVCVFLDHFLRARLVWVFLK